MVQVPATPNYVKCSSDLVNAIKWLVENQQYPSEILVSSFRNYLEDSFVTAFNTLFWKLSLSEFKLLMQMPDQMISFYNDTIRARASLLSTDFFCKAQEFWPPEELLMLQPDYKFVDVEFQTNCETLMKNLCLPHFTGEPQSSIDLWMYVNDVTCSTGDDKDMLLLSIKHLLEQDSTNYWPHVISKCAYYVICKLCSKIENFLERDLFVVKADLEAINFDKYWQSLSISLKKNELLAIERNQLKYELEELKKRKFEFLKKRKIDDAFHQKLDSTKKEFLENSYFSETAGAPDVASSKVSNLLNNLQAAVKKQNIESEEFMQKLNSSIAGKTGNKADGSMNILTERKNISQDHNSLELSSFLNTSQDLNAEFSPLKKTKTNSVDCDTSVPNLKLKTDDWRAIVGRTDTAKDCSTPSSISERLAELRYNIQRNNLLEDSLCQFLNT